jgi:hypothetical protein
MLKEDLIIDLLKESRKQQQKDGSDISDIKSSVAVMQVDVQLNKEDLRNHMEQTRAVKALTLDIRKEAADERKALKAELNEDIAAINKKLTAGHLFKMVLAGASAVGIVAGAIGRVMGLL